MAIKHRIKRVKMGLEMSRNSMQRRSLTGASRSLFYDYIESSAEQSSAVQSSAEQCSTEQCSTEQYRAEQCSTEQCSTEQSRAVLYCAAMTKRKREVIA
jgi:hypothetical protein